MRNRKSPTKTPEQVAQRIHKETIDNKPMHYAKDPLGEQKIIQTELSALTNREMKSSVTAFYRDAKTGLVKPMAQADITALCNRLKGWSETDEKAFTINQFCVREGIPRSTLYEMAEKIEEVRDALDYALLSIADRRQIGAITREIDGKYSLFQIQRYDPEIRREMEWQASIAQKDDAQTGNITVVMQDFPASPLVPERKKAKQNDE